MKGLAETLYPRSEDKGSREVGGQKKAPAYCGGWILRSLRISARVSSLNRKTISRGSLICLVGSSFGLPEPLRTPPLGIDFNPNANILSVILSDLNTHPNDSLSSHLLIVAELVAHIVSTVHQIVRSVLEPTVTHIRHFDFSLPLGLIRLLHQIPRMPIGFCDINQIKQIRLEALYKSDDGASRRCGPRSGAWQTEKQDRNYKDWTKQ